MRVILLFYLIIIAVFVTTFFISYLNIEQSQKEEREKEPPIISAILDNVFQTITSASNSRQPSGMTIPVSGTWKIDTNASIIYFERTMNVEGELRTISYKLEFPNVKLTTAESTVHNPKILNAFPQPDGTVFIVIA